MFSFVGSENGGAVPLPLGGTALVSTFFGGASVAGFCWIVFGDAKKSE